jgi:hypothetical protein
MLIGAFLLTSGGYYALMLRNLFWLQEEVVTKEDHVLTLETDKTVLQKQVSDLQAREKVFSQTLQIMQDDMPSLEVLNALESNMDGLGMGFNTLRFNLGRGTGANKEPDVVEVTGMATTDKQIIDYADRLRASGVFRDVFLPSTVRSEQSGMINFTLRMPVFPIGQIRAQ